MAGQCLPIGQSWRVVYNQSKLSTVLRKQIVTGQSSVFSAFYRQNSYDSDILNHMSFADKFTIWVVHLPEETKTGLITASDQTFARRA